MDWLAEALVFAWISVPMLYLYWCCCTTCTTESQNFDGASSTPTGYNETVGTWTYSANRAHPGASGDILVYDTAWADTYYRVSATIRTDTASDVLAVVGAYSDSSNYYSAEVTIAASSATLKIFKTVAGSRTQLATGVALNSFGVDTDITVVLCFSQSAAGNNQISAWMNRAAGDVATPGSAYIVGPVNDTALTLPGKAGMYARTAAGSVDFDDFLISTSLESSASCPACESNCACCTHGMPANVDLTITGGSFAGSYTLPFEASAASAAQTCVWRLNNAFSVSCFGTTYTDIAVYLSDACTVKVEVGTSGFSLGFGSTIGNDTTNGEGDNWVDVQAAEDLFTRGDSTNLGSNWTEQTGDWEILSNQLSISGTGIASWAGTFNATDDYRIHTCIVALNDDNDQAGVIFYFTDTNNYYSFEIEGTDVSAGDFTAKIIKCSGGTRTTLASGSNTGVGSTLTLRVFIEERDNGLYIRGLVVSGGVDLYAFDSSPLAAGPVGAIAHAVTTSVQFDTLDVVTYACDEWSSVDIATTGSAPFGCTAPTSISISAAA